MRGLIALVVGAFLLSHGWARASCSPVAVDISYRTRVRIISQPKDCVKVWSIFAPILGGFLSAFQRTMGARASLKSIGKKRIQVLSYAMGASVLFPFALLQLALVAGQSPWQFGASFWSLSSIVAFGIVIAFFSESYSEEKLLMPVHSLKAFQIVTCCVCGLELLYGLDISLVGFLFCSLVFGIGVQELALLQGHLSWEELGDTADGSLVYASWIRRPLQHIISDKKSRKIAIFLLINTGFMVVEFFYGFLSNSLGLISDACHMLFDCAALAIGLYASYISRLPENSKYNYGYGRFEVVSGYANAVLLVLVASLIVLESIERILEPPEISTESLLLVSVGGLLVNIVGLIFFHEEHHHAHGSVGQSCSHSHSSHKSPPIESSSKAAKVEFSAVICDGSSQPLFHDHHHSVAANGIVHHHHRDDSLPQRKQEHGNLHELKDHAHIHSSHEHNGGDCYHHEHHDHDEGHNHDNGHQHDSSDQGHGCEHQDHDHSQNGHYDHYQQHKNEHQFGSSHDHCHHQHQGCDSPHHEHHDHQHVCSSDHVHNQPQEHDGVDHGHHDHDHHEDQDHDHNHHNHGHDHDHGHNHNHDHDHNHNHDHDHDHDHDQHDDDDDHHHHHMDHNMYGIFLHVLADTLGSVGVVISTLFIKYKGWLITDPACSIFLSALIIASVIPLVRNSAEILLQRVPRHNENNLKTAMKRISRIAGVTSMGSVHVWSFTNTSIVGSLHLQLSAGSNRKLIQEKTSRLLHDAGIGDLTLQIEEL